MKTTPRIKEAWEQIQVAKHNLEEAKADFKRASAVMAEWLGESGLQYLEPEEAWRRVLDKTSQDILFLKSFGRLDVRTKELLKWYHHFWSELDSVKSALAYWQTVFKNQCAKEGLDPKEVEVELAEEWRAQLFGEEKK
jgi:hypothetical protein